MHELPLEAEFRAFAKAPLGAVQGGLLVARVLDAACAVDWVAAELQRLADTAGPGADPLDVLATLETAGFRGADDYYALANSSIEQVLRTRRGIPISLALVVIGVAERLELSATGINFPRHFLVQVEDCLIDPFALRIVDEAWLTTALTGQPVNRAQALVPASPVDIVLRMLNNLRMIAVQRGEAARALDLTGYQLVLGADPLPLHVARADLWIAAGVPDMACHELDCAIALAPTTDLRARLQERRQLLASAPSRVH